jgi:hypothetical protein
MPYIEFLHGDPSYHDNGSDPSMILSNKQIAGIILLCSQRWRNNGGTAARACTAPDNTFSIIRNVAPLHFESQLDPAPGHEQLTPGL